MLGLTGKLLAVLFLIAADSDAVKGGSYEFDTVLIHQSENQKVIVAVETTGYLSAVGIEAGVNSLLIFKESGSLIVNPGPHRGYAEKILETIERNHDFAPAPVKWVFNSSARPENVMV